MTISGTSELRNKGRRRGATMIEFSLGFLIFLIVLLGIMEFGRAVWTYTTVAHAAKQATRYAMIRGTAIVATDAEVRAVAEKNAIGLSKSDLGVFTTWTPDRERGSFVQVRITYPVSFLASSLVSSTPSVLISSTSRHVVVR